MVTWSASSPSEHSARTIAAVWRGVKCRKVSRTFSMVAASVAGSSTSERPETAPARLWREEAKAFSQVRADVHDLEAILEITNTERDAVISAVADNSDAIFTWDYEKGARPKLNRLYEKAKTSMWNGETDLPWDTVVDQEQVVMANAQGNIGPESGIDISGTPMAKWTEKEWIQFGVESQNWTLSQFMHGEQGALICTAKIVETVPWIDAKYYAATQVMDEARHVEVFAKYLDTKLSGHYPLNAHLGLLLDDIIEDSRWDMTYLGMQIMVEGLALAAFGFMHQMTEEPLLKQLLRYVMSDEARHVAFGVLSLQGLYTAEMSGKELREREDFVIEATALPSCPSSLAEPAGLEDALLGLVLRAAVHAERMGGIGLDIRAVLGAVEDVVGGEVGDPGAHLPGGLDHEAGAQGVDLLADGGRRDLQRHLPLGVAEDGGRRADLGIGHRKRRCRIAPGTD